MAFWGKYDRGCVSNLTKADEQSVQPEPRAARFLKSTLVGRGPVNRVVRRLSTRVAHQYKRRTWDEALELAKAAFRSSVSDNLAPDEIEELRTHATVGGLSAHEDWAAILGHRPDMRDYYEVELYRPSDQCPYVAKVFVRMLVPRDRASDTIHFIWRPVIPPYNGPYFE